MLYKFFMSAHVFVCLSMILIVLLQTGRGAGLAVFGGGDSLINTPSGSSFMKKFTAGLAAAFAFTSLFLTLLQNRSGMASVTGTVAESPVPPPAPAPAPPPAPAEPAAAKK